MGVQMSTDGAQALPIDEPTTPSDTVVLARSMGGVNFGFENLTPEMQNLFETKQLMAVIVNPAQLGTPRPSANAPQPPAGTPVFDRDVVIADWGMTAAVGDAANATAYANILILKYGTGALLDLVAKPDTWASSRDFSLVPDGGSADSLLGLSSFLQAYLKDAIEAAGNGNTLYEAFAAIVQDPGWRGFIVLAADVDPSGFPDQIKGLIAGIDFHQFRAHHFGATSSRVVAPGSPEALDVPSSLFGLIDYQLPAFRDNFTAAGAPDMPLPLPSGFEVLDLRALFGNAALVDFCSRVRLAGQGIVLNGTYQRQGSTGVYVFEQSPHQASPGEALRAWKAGLGEGSVTKGPIGIERDHKDAVAINEALGP